MKTIQKKTFGRSLVIGAISICFVALSGCATDTDYYAETSYVYVNDTDKTISIYNTSSLEELAENEILLLPSARDTIKIQGDSGKRLDPLICCGEHLRVIIYEADFGKTLVKIDGMICELESVANIDNYSYEQPHPRKLYYTFVFTEEVLAEKANCKSE